MKNNHLQAHLIAMVNAHNALLNALCDSHPDPKALLKAFEARAAEDFAATDEAPKIGGIFQTLVEQKLTLLRKRA